MSAHFKHKYLASAIALTILIPSVSYAETDEFQIEKILVTAQKRTQSIQDVPISLTAISGDIITESGITGLDDLSSYVPNLTIVKGNDIQIRMRGLGSGINKGFEQSVGMYVDGVYFGRDRQYRGPLFDLERVEVLRGPQSILFGKNTIAGAVNITTAKPSDDFWAKLAFKVGTDNQREARLALSGPLTDTLSGRLAVIDNHQDGYVENNLDDKDGPENDNQTVRATLLWEPSDDWSATLKLENGEYEIHGMTSQMVEMGIYGGLLSLYDPAIEFKLDEHNSYDTTFGEHSAITHTDNATLTLERALGEHTLTSITAYTAYDSEDSLDNDWSPIPLLFTFQTQDYKQFSQELRFTSPGEELIDYIVGVYYQDNSLDFTTDTTLNLHAISQPYGGIFKNAYYQDSDSWAAFAEVTWNITQKLSLSGGLRYTQENKDITATNQNFELDGSLASPTTNHIFSTVLAVSENYDISDKRDESNLTPLIKAQYKFNDDQMGYITASKGFKGGGFNMFLGTPSTQSFEYEEEEATAVEAGLKSMLFDNQVQLNTALFRTEFDNLQVSGFNGIAVIVGNAAEATTQGIEIDGLWLITENLTIGASYAYLDAEYDNYTNAPCTDVGIANGCVEQDLSGERLPYAPENSASLNVEYVHSLGEHYLLSFDANINYSDKTFLQLDADPIDTQDAYAKVNARLTLTNTDSDWELALIARNLTDQQTSTSGLDLPILNGGAHIANLEPPRTISLEFRSTWW